MKFFGQYLVEKNILTEETLVEALVEQLKTMPSLTEVVYELKLFPTGDFLSILALQAQAGLEFKRAAEQLKLWSQDKEEKVSAFLSEKRIPLGQILVRTGKVEFQEITRALDEFLGGLEEAHKEAEPAKVLEMPKAEAVTPPAAEPTAAAPATIVTLDQSSSDNKTDANFQFSAIDPASLQNYAALMDATRNTALKGMLEVIKTGQKSADGFGPEESLVLLWQGLHEVRGLSRFIQANVTEQLVAAMEELTELAMKDPKQVQGEFAASFVTSVSQGVEVVWNIKQILEDRASEESYWIASKDSYLKLLKELESLKSKLSGSTNSQEAA